MPQLCPMDQILDHHHLDSKKRGGFVLSPAPYVLKYTFSVAFCRLEDAGLQLKGVAADFTLA